MASQSYPYYYLHKHPEEYVRLKPDDIHNNEAVVSLCEEILKGINIEVDNLVRYLRITPNSENLQKEARDMNAYLLSDPISSISFGGSVEVAKAFRNKCPKGVFEN